jgi:hypothetical protein
MKLKVNTIGRDVPYGNRVVIADDEQAGEIAIREMYPRSLDELFNIVDDAEQSYEIRLTESIWDRYEADVTIISHSR